MSVISNQPGFLVPSNVPEVANLFRHITLIAVFQTSPRVGWCSQALNVPILATREARILIRDDSFTDADCPQLEEELEQRMSEIRHARTVGSINIFGHHNRPEPSSAPTTEANLTATSLSQSVLAPVLPNLLHVPAAPFPLPHTIDMVTRLQKIRAGLEGVKKTETITKTLALFQQHFPGSQYVRSTFYHAQNVYLRACEVEDQAGLIKTYVGYGQTDKGAWKNFRDAVNRESTKYSSSPIC
jgi:hypothetical protein